MNKKEAIRNAENFDEILDVQYGKIGTKKRDEFELKAQYFVISEILKEARREAKMTQQLAEKSARKKVIFRGSKTANATFSFRRFTAFSRKDSAEK